jgi:hypothetical protein
MDGCAHQSVRRGSIGIGPADEPASLLEQSVTIGRTARPSSAPSSRGRRGDSARLIGPGGETPRTHPSRLAALQQTAKQTAAVVNMFPGNAHPAPDPSPRDGTHVMQAAQTTEPTEFDLNVDAVMADILAANPDMTSEEQPPVQLSLAIPGLGATVSAIDYSYRYTNQFAAFDI